MTLKPASFRLPSNKFFRTTLPLLWVFCCGAFFPFTCEPSNNSSVRILGAIVVAQRSPSVASGGNTAYLTAVGIYTDATVEDLTSKVTWTNSNPSIGSFAGQGRFVTSSQGGLATIYAADPSGVVGTLAITVTGPGPVIPLTGTVQDAYYRPNSNEVWVTTQTTVAIINSKTNTLQSSISLAGNAIPAKLIFNSSGSQAYLATTGTGTNAIWSIDANTKSLVSSIPTSDGGSGVDLAKSPDDQLIYYAETTTGTENKGVYRISTSSFQSLTSTLFDNAYNTPVGLAISSTGRLVVSDMGSTPSLLYIYPSYLTTSGSVSLPPTGWNPGLLFTSPSGQLLIANGDSAHATLVIQASNNSILQSISDYGKWLFFSDGIRALSSRKTAGNFQVYDYSTTPLTVKDTLNYNPAGVGAITPATTLYLPVSGTSNIQVYQYF